MPIHGATQAIVLSSSTHSPQISMPIQLATIIYLQEDMALPLTVLHNENYVYKNVTAWLLQKVLKQIERSQRGKGQRMNYYG